jgi:hypothetical protein
VSANLVVKTVNVLGRAYRSATASFDDQPLQAAGSPGVMTIPLEPATKGGLVKVNAPGWTAQQKVTINLGLPKPTIAFDGLQAIDALRVAVASAGADFNLEIHFVVDVDLRNALDGIRGAIAGPYNADGRSVPASPQFRMSQVAPDQSTRGFKPKYPMSVLRDKVKDAHIPDSTFGAMLAARPTVQQLVRLNQALVDALMKEGPPAYDLHTPEGVRAMGWDYGVGIDCAGYVQQAFMASRNETRREVLGLKSSMGDENLAGLSGRPQFRKIDIRRARTGDLIVLDPPDGEHVGHTVIVYTHQAAESDIDLVALFPEAKNIVQGLNSGPSHLYLVDASWGAGPGGGWWGGVQRNMWTFNETSMKWGYSGHGLPVFADRPYNHPLDGAYRRRIEV